MELRFWLLTMTFILLIGCQKSSKPIEAIAASSPVVTAFATPIRVNKISPTPIPVTVGVDLPGILSWQGLKTKYAHFSQIQVVLVNKGKASIFLNSHYPQHSEAP